MSTFTKLAIVLVIWFGFWIAMAVVLPADLKSMVVVGGMFGFVLTLFAIFVVADE